MYSYMYRYELPDPDPLFSILLALNNPKNRNPCEIAIGFRPCRSTKNYLIMLIIDRTNKIILLN